MSPIKLEPAVSRGMEVVNPCAACTVRDLAICNALDDGDLKELAGIARTVRVQPQETVTEEGERADFLYNLTAGAVRLCKLLPDGRRQITGFLFPGDFVGIALVDTYAFTAEAIEDCQLCRFPRRDLESLLSKQPKLEKRLLGLAAHELSQAQDQMVLLGRKTAIEKVASFLIMLSKRQSERGGAASPVYLPMSRADMADFLGLTTETVSRTITSLKRAGTIRLQEKNLVALSDPDRMREAAEGH